MPGTSALRAPEAGVTAETLIERARELIPTLRKRAEDAEKLRTLPPETVQDFLEAGFYRALQPRRFGGYELGLPAFCEIMKNISRGCGSSGWVLCLTSAHTFHLAAFPEAGQIEVYGEDGDVRAPLIFAPQGTAVPVAGGYRLAGRWNYNSGGEHSNWVALSAVVPGDGEGVPPRDLILAFIRREDYSIFDNWHVMGMRATGSKQAGVEDVFVPERRVISQPAWLRGDAPGFGVYENAFYRTPPMQVFCCELASICVGLAEAAVDAFHERALTKVSPWPPFAKLSHERSAQRRVGRARARADAADAMLQHMIANQLDLIERAQRGAIEFGEEPARRAFMHAQQTLRLVRDCVESLFDGSGTSATQSGQSLERIYRDLTMIRTHYLMDEDRTTENWGAAFFGHAPYSPF